MQICSNVPAQVRPMVIPLDPDFPIHAPYLERLHYSPPHPAEYLHYHHTWEIGICFQGSGIFYIDRAVYRYAAGDVIVVPPNVVHIAQSDAENISGWKFLDIDLTSMLSSLPAEFAELSDCSFKGIVHSGDRSGVAPLVMLILDEMCRSRPHSRTLIRLKVAELALFLRRLSAGNMTASVLPDSLNEISPAVLYIINHYQEPITLEQLSSMCYKSVSSFRRSFARAMNTSPFEYLYQVRIKTAVNLLQTTHLPVVDIASQVGYQSLSSFNRHFLRITGMTPLACRKRKDIHEVIV